MISSTQHLGGGDSQSHVTFSTSETRWSSLDVRLTCPTSGWKAAAAGVTSKPVCCFHDYVKAAKHPSEPQASAQQQVVLAAVSHVESVISVRVIAADAVHDGIARAAARGCSVSPVCTDF